MLHDYYERSELWEPSAYQSGYERDRLLAAARFVPAGVKTLLDVGCGNAAFLSSLEQVRPEISAVGVDPSQAALSKRWCSSPVVRGDIGALPFRDGSFDVVSSMAVLEHVPTQHLTAGLAEICRVSRQYVVIDLPFRERRTRIRCPECGCGFDPHLHLRSYSESDIRALFPDFEVTASQVLRGTESLLPYLVLRLLRREISAARFPNAVCPQCHHRSSPAQPASAAAGSRPGLLKRLWARQPRVSVEREIFVAFRRA